jgi:hypothetical protein
VNIRHQIDLNRLLPEGIRFTPLFEKESDYREFRERYAFEVVPELDEQTSKRRKSEEESRHRHLG